MEETFSSEDPAAEDKSTRTIGKTGMSVKEGIVGSLKGINEIEAEIVNLVRDTVANSLRATGSVAGEGVSVASDVVKGAIAATEEVGIGLAESTKSVAKGIIMGVNDVGGDVISVAGAVLPKSKPAGSESIRKEAV